MLIPKPASAFLLSILKLTNEDTGSTAIVTLGLLVLRTSTFGLGKTFFF